MEASQKFEDEAGEQDMTEDYVVFDDATTGSAGHLDLSNLRKRKTKIISSAKETIENGEWWRLRRAPRVGERKSSRRCLAEAIVHKSPDTPLLEWLLLHFRALSERSERVQRAKVFTITSSGGLERAEKKCNKHIKMCLGGGKKSRTLLPSPQKYFRRRFPSRWWKYAPRSRLLWIKRENCIANVLTLEISALTLMWWWERRMSTKDWRWSPSASGWLNLLEGRLKILFREPRFLSATT